MTSFERDINVVLKNANQFILHTVQVAADVGSATNSIYLQRLWKRKQKPHAPTISKLLNFSNDQAFQARKMEFKQVENANRGGNAQRT